MMNRRVTHLNTAEQTLTFQDQGTLHYDALLLMTGSTPVPLEVPVAERPSGWVAALSAPGGMLAP